MARFDQLRYKSIRVSWPDNAPPSACTRDAPFHRRSWKRLVTEKITRRDFIVSGTLTSAALAAGSDVVAAAAVDIAKNPREGAWARWLDGRAPAVESGATWGMPWPKGKHRARSAFALRNAMGV